MHFKNLKVVGAEGESGRCRLMHGDLEEVALLRRDVARH